MMIAELIEFEDLNKEAEEIRETFSSSIGNLTIWRIIKKRKGIISVAYHQGKVFKRFKEKEKLVRLVSELGIHKTLFLKLMFLNSAKNTPNYWGLL